MAPPVSVSLLYHQIIVINVIKTGNPNVFSVEFNVYLFGDILRCPPSILTSAWNFFNLAVVQLIVSVQFKIEIRTQGILQQ